MLYFTPYYGIKFKLDGQTKFISTLILGSKTDGQLFFTPHIGIHARETDRQTTLYFTPYIGIQVKRIHRQTTYFSFHPSYLNSCKTNRWTNYVSCHSQLINIGSKQDGQTFFHTSYWNPRKTDRWTNVSFHSLYWLVVLRISVALVIFQPY